MIETSRRPINKRTFLPDLREPFVFVRRGFPFDPSPLPRSCQRESGVSDKDTLRRIWQPTINTRTRVVAPLGDRFLGAKCSTEKATDAREPSVPHALVSRGRACIADHLSEMRARPSVRRSRARCARSLSGFRKWRCPQLGRGSGEGRAHLGAHL